MIKNKYEVPQKLWKSMKTQEAKTLYNSMMDQMVPNQSITVHPKTPKMPANQWFTICHNAACYAAWALAKAPLIKGDTVVDIDKKAETVKVHKAK